MFFHSEDIGFLAISEKNKHILFACHRRTNAQTYTQSSHFYYTSRYGPRKNQLRQEYNGNENHNLNFDDGFKDPSMFSVICLHVASIV